MSMISTANSTIGIYTLAVSAKMCNDNSMINQTTMTVFVTPDHDTSLIFSDWQRVDTRSIQDACIAADRAERDAARAARESGAVFTDWCISDRD